MEVVKTQIIIEQQKLLIDQLTTRNLGFISDPELTQITKGILGEIDRVFGVSGFRSALYLSVSAAEGILKHLIQLNWNEASKEKVYPRDKSGKPKKIEDVDLSQCIDICTQISLIPRDLEATYDRLRKFRNYIHPYLELKSASEINIGISQIGIGILNTTLLLFDQLRFIEGSKWRVVTGDPKYLMSNSQLILEEGVLPTNSFIMTDHYTNRDFSLEFDSMVVKDSILNFVYNFSSDESFNMIRIDKRDYPDDGLLECYGKYKWKKISRFNNPPRRSEYRHHVIVKVRGTSLEFNVDSEKLELVAGNWNYDPKKSIGFFNELKKVDISSLTVGVQIS